MKIIYTLLFLFSFISNYGQPPRPKINYNIPGSPKIKNDSITNITNDTSNNIKLIGNWDFIDPNNFFNEHLIGHCPVYINPDKIILEFAKWDKDFVENTLDVNTKIIKMNDHFLKNQMKLKSKIIESSYNENLKYYVYKISIISKFNKEKKAMYYLIGEKKDYVYFLACYNFNEDYFENIDSFLINLFRIN